jgi:hypothetical protein
MRFVDGRRLDRWFLATHRRRLFSYAVGVVAALAILIWPLIDWQGWLGHRPIRAVTALCVAPFLLVWCWRNFRRELAEPPK